MTDPKKPALIGAVKGEPSAISLRDGAIHLATWNANTLKGELFAVPVDGSGPRSLGALEPGKTPTDQVTHIDVTGDSVFIARAGALLRVPTSGGAIEVVAESFGTTLALHGEFAYGARFDKEGKRDLVVRVPTKGGTVEEIHARPREGTQETHGMGGGATDGTTLFVGDAGKRTILAIDLATKGVTELAKGVAYPFGLALGPGTIRITTINSLLEIPRAGGVPRPIAPEGHDYRYATDAGFAYVYETPNDNSEVTFAAIKRQPLGGGAPEPVAIVKDDLQTLFADEGCLYFTRHENGQTLVTAMSKEPMPAK